MEAEFAATDPTDAAQQQTPAAAAPLSPKTRRRAYQSLGIDGRSRKMAPWEIELKRQERLEAQKRKEQAGWQLKVLQAIGKGPPTKTNAARKAGVSVSKINTELAENEEFARAFTEAFQAARDGAFEVAWRMGVTGEREPIVWQGQIVGYRRVVDAKMTKFVLQAMDPETFDPRVRATQVQAKSLGDVTNRRAQMLEDFSKRFESFDAARQKALTGAVIDVAVSDTPASSVDLDDEDDDDDD